MMTMMLLCLITLLIFVATTQAYPRHHDYDAILDMQWKHVLPWPLATGKTKTLFLSFNQHYFGDIQQLHFAGGGSYRVLTSQQLEALGQQWFGNVPPSQNATALALTMFVC
jgi:hypothetical protein